ncbi:MAG: transposase [Planctomycetes bacterium]|nr:transposase [Planctomycetota bacterium]
MIGPMDTPPDDPGLLVQYLTSRDTPCPRCGYNLRENKNQRCPECGEELKLQIGLVYPKLGLYMTTIIGLAMGTGFSLLLMLYMVFGIVILGWRHDPDLYAWFLVTGGGVLIEGAPMLACVAYPHVMHRRGRIVRVSFALIAWVLTVTNLAIFAAICLG